MKKVAYIMIGFACLTSAALGESRFGPFASWLNSNSEDAFGGGLKYEWLFTQNLGVDVRASYLSDEDMYVIPLELGLVGVWPLQGLSLYASLGGGYYIPEDVSRDYGFGEIEGPDAAFGFYGAAGIRLPAADNMEFFAEVKYTKAESDEETGGGYWRNSYNYVVSETTKLGMDLDGVGVNAGLLWTF